MSFDWTDFLKLSSDLMNGDEAKRRTAVSRAYYATFGYIRRYAEAYLDFHPKNNGDDHGGLRHCLNQAGERAQANRLQTLQQWRGECDYHGSIGETQLDQIVDNSVKSATALIKYFSTR